MKYHLLLEHQGQFRQEQMDLPVDSEIAWHDFVNLKAVKEFLLANPNFVLLDVTPDSLNEIENTDNTDAIPDDLSLLEHSDDV